jgi:molecular chaperone DnaK
VLESPTHLLVAAIAESFRRTKGTDISQRNEALLKLLAAVEKAVQELQTQDEAELHVPFITTDETGPLHLRHRLTREDALRMADVRDVGQLLD